MAVRASLLLCACVIGIISADSADINVCPSNCRCVAYETDCSKLQLYHFPDANKLRVFTEYLQLNDNFLDDVPRLNSLPKLQELDLSNNLIRMIEQDAFVDTTELTRLNLSQNRIDDILPVHFQSLAKLESLDLSHNILKEIGDFIFDGNYLKWLQMLDLSYNQIHSISKNSFNRLRELHVLKLNNNRLKSIQHHPFNDLNQISVLNLHGNNIDTIEEKSFYPMDDLMTLTLNKNKLKDLNKMALYNLKSLEKLDISDNQLNEVPLEAIDDLLSLDYLNLGGNPISVLKKEDLPFTLRQVTQLILTNMPNLRDIHANAFDNMPHLSVVNISGNPRLELLPSTVFFASSHSLRDVDISNNSLSSLDPKMLPWNLLFSIKVTGNKWRCDCNSRWMTNCSFENQIRCNTPKNLADRIMVDIPLYELRCDDGSPQGNLSYSQRVRIALAVSSIVLSAVVIVGVIFKMRKRLPCCKQTAKYISLYNIYNPGTDNSSIVVTFRGDKTETKSGGVDIELEKDML